MPPSDDKAPKHVVLINVFSVEPQNQPELVRLLGEATETTVRHIEGFVSATLHRSLDGTKVTMYARWRSEADYNAMRRNSTSSPFLEQALTLASFAPGMYEIVSTYLPSGG